jgi:WD40 repeat protein
VALLVLTSGTFAILSADEPAKPKETVRVPFAHDCAVGAVGFAPDGVHLVSGAEDGVIRVWNRETGLRTRELPGHRGRVSALSFSPDGTTLASGSGDQTVAIWDFSTGKLLHRCDGHDGWVRSVHFSPDGRTIASGSYDETLRVWDVASGKELRRFEGHEAPVSALAFAPDGKTLVSCDHDNVGRLWDPGTGKQVRVLPKQRRGELTGVAFCACGRLIVTGAAQGYYSLWDADTGHLLTRIASAGTVLSLVASPSGQFFLAGTADGYLQLCEAASRQSVVTFPGYDGDWNPVDFFPTRGVATAIHALAFSPDGTWIAAGTKDGRVRLWRFADLVLGSDKPRKIRPQDLDTVWNDLASPEPMAGCRAMANLATAPELAVPLVKSRLTPTPRFDARRVAALMAQLDDDDFAVRERATEELGKYSETVRPVLRDAQRGGRLSVEAASRVRRLLERLDGTESSPDRLRETRVVQALEWMTTPEARAHLAEIAKGEPGSWLTEEANQALARLARRPPK